MLTIHGHQPRGYCDGESRRNFFRVGGLAAGSLLFPELLRRRAAAEPAHVRANKSIIMICLGGGPSHIDTYDMRPDAPSEYRGEFRPTASKVAGMPMCELMPRQAAIADRFAVVRSMTWKEPCHQYSEICTGYPVK
jgi:hypothetical protein